MQSYNSNSLLIVIVLTFLLAGCSSKEPSDKTGTTDKKESTETVSMDPMKNKGIGPITSVTLGAEIDQEMVAKGKEVYDLMCTACHKPTEKFIGPAPAGVLDRRSPEWVMNMILNPEEMTQKDPIARALLIQFNGSPMANQNLTEEEARAILEYFRTL